MLFACPQAHDVIHGLKSEWPYITTHRELWHCSMPKEQILSMNGMQEPGSPVRQGKRQKRRVGDSNPAGCWSVAAVSIKSATKQVLPFLMLVPRA